MTEWVVFGAGTPGAPNEADGPIAISTVWFLNDPGTYWCTGIEWFAPSGGQPGGSSIEAALWERDNEAGGKLATETVLATTITPSVRNRIMFATPVPISQALYPDGFIATVGVPLRYTATAGYFATTTHTSGPITAPENVTTHGFNGRFKVGVSTADYPDGTFNGGGYWVSPIVTDVDPGGTSVEVVDSPGPAAAGGTPETVTSDAVVTDAPGGAHAGGSPASAEASVTVTDAPGGLLAGGSPSVVTTGETVTVVDSPGGAAAGGTPDTVTASETLPDVSVWPLLAGALVCLQDAMATVEKPPRYVSIRPGVAFSAGLSQVEDECCEGSAWLRVVSIAPTDDFPTPRTTASNCAPAALAVTLELGALRCRPVTATGKADRIVTGAQWAEVTRLIMGDAAALRRAACCITDLAGNGIIGTWSPEAIEANCAGGTMQLTIQAPNCDITC